MKKEVILLIYGEGGHTAQMKRLVSLLKKEGKSNISFVGISDIPNNYIEGLIDYYYVLPLRRKYGNWKNIFLLPKIVSSYICAVLRILGKYKIKGIISTGPGIVIPFVISFKIFRVKIVFIETWSRFYTKSLTGRIMYFLSNMFIVQNKELKKLYPKATYGGLL